MLPRHCFAGVLGLAALLCVVPGYGVDPTAPAAGAQSSVAGGNSSLGLPAFRPGLWEYRRTQISSGGGKPQTATIRKCSDPTAEFKQKLAQLKQRGCVFGPMKQQGQRYEATWRCSAPDGAILAMRDVITVNSEESYLNESEAFVSHEATHSTIVATRQGDCPTAAPMPPRR
ncbi:MAG: DUF3617 domain-containing protein [Steroidobacteraceae bacterium]